MTGGAHLSAGHGEGQRRHGCKHLPVREAASGQGATSASPTGLTGWPRPSGEGEGGSGRLRKENGGGPRLGRKPKLGPIQVINLFRIFFEIQFFLATLEICAARFRRDFGMTIFPKFF
jgi:hypothetical protein